MQARLRDALFVLRCTLTAAAAYLIALWLGLDYPSWAAVSAIIVTQERISDTRSATLQRLAGTLAGVVTAMVTGIALAQLQFGTVVQMSAGVAIAAWIARKWPQLKVAMWTVPIVYLSHAADPQPLADGLWRGAEVLVGGLTGAAIHFLVDALFRRLMPAQAGAAGKIDHPE
ncbi:fusaric acid resistance family protein [Rhodobacter sp. 140A]|nr:fusaric acid resistance family protein [Rhodobacter sp. 140A]